MARPKLGHYRVDLGVASSERSYVAVVPPRFGSTDEILLWIVKEAAVCVELSPSQARRIAQGLIICADIKEHPTAVAGPIAEEE